MKILFLNTNIGYGGASKMMGWVASQCAEAGHEVVFMTYRDSTVNQELSPKIKHIHKQLEDKSGKQKHFISCVRFIRNYIKTEQIDLAISFLSPSHLRLSIACLGTNCRTLFSERGDPTQKPTTLKGRILNLFLRKAFSSADKFVFQTPMAAACFPKSVQNRSCVISNPIKPLVRTSERVVGGDKNIVCVARLDIKQKRQDVLIEAFKLISSRYPDYSLQLYGDGPEYDEKILKMSAEGNQKIHFMGPTKDVRSAIQCATMTVLSSDFEGIPNALLESMSIGTPSVATDCTPGGAAMLIRDKENGLLVPRGNVQALAEAIEYVITHPEEAERMGRCGLDVNRLYAEKVIADRWLNFIQTDNQ